MRARVAVVAPQEARELALLLQRAGHEYEEFANWAEFRDSCQSGEAWDLVLYDDSAAAGAPDDIEVPGILVSDGDDEVGFAELGVTLTPLTAIAAQLKSERAHRQQLENIVDGLATGKALAGRCPVMRRLQGSISRAAASDSTVLIEGPVGSGKSVAARMIHCGSRRADRALRSVESSTVDAPTMAQLLSQSSSTTVVFESIDELPTAAQAALVKHLKERSSPRAGPAPRIIATTSAHLPELIAKGLMREDLYYRLNAYPMVMPALREHTEDIGDIAEAILHLTSAQSGRPSVGLSPSALALLESMQWPGNVTQLEAVVNRAHVLAAGNIIEREHITVATPATGTNSGAVSAAAPTQVNDVEQELTEEDIRPFEEEEQTLLSRALRATKGNVRRAAQLLGIGRATLYRKIQQYKLRLQ